MNFETVQTGYELLHRLLRPTFRVDHEQHVREASSKVSAVAVMMSRALRIVHVHAFWTIQFYHGLSGHVTQSCGMKNNFVIVESMNTLSRFLKRDLSGKNYSSKKRRILLTDGKQRLTLTINAWTVAEVSVLVFFKHLSNAPGNENISFSRLVREVCVSREHG